MPDAHRHRCLHRPAQSGRLQTINWYISISQRLPYIVLTCSDSTVSGQQSASRISPNRQSRPPNPPEHLKTYQDAAKDARNPTFKRNIQGAPPSGLSNGPQNPAKTSAHHQPNQQNTDTPPFRRNTSLGLIDTSNDDELLPFPSSTNPTTPCLKRKHGTSTPPTAFLSALYQTPKACDVAGSSEAGTTKSTSKSDRKAFLKRVKRGWTRKGGTPVKESAGKSTGKRRSLGGGLVNLEIKKRKWVDDGDGSEDELNYL